MFNIIDTRNQTIVAQAFDFAEAKAIAGSYRRAQHIPSEQWQLVAIKKKKEAPVRTTYFTPGDSGDDGCCDRIRDRRREVFGVGFR